MVIVNGFPTKIVSRVLGKLALLLICGAASLGSLWAQKEPAKSASTDNTSTKSQDGSSALGFSIESEMLTYRALESDSEAVACDIAAYLNGGVPDFRNPPAGEVCAVNAGTNSTASVVIVPFDRSAFDDFHLWRADMQTMNELRKRAATYCPASPVRKERGASAPGEAHAAGAAAGSALSFTPAGSALSLAQSALALMSSETSTSPVGGTIEDQAFMDGVARELRSFSVRVLMPTTYGPYSLGVTDESRSPFLSSLNKLFEARACLEDQKAKDDTRGKEKELKSDAKDKEANRDAKASLIADIDAYLATLGGRSPAPATTSPPSKSDEKSGGVPSPPPASSPSHLMALLSADGLAQKLGVDPATGFLPDSGAWQHILLLRALESGGAIQKKSSIFGTKLRYSGGSIGTYALFSTDGELECSGNVYDYGGSIPAERFKEELRQYKPDPAAQFIFQRGGCRAIVKH